MWAMTSPKNLITAAVYRYASRLRFPYLFLITAIVFVLDLAIPDLIPFVDEVLLGLFTVILGSLRKREKNEPNR